MKAMMKLPWIYTHDDASHTCHCMLPFLEFPNMTIPKKNLDVLIGYWVRISNP
jgi:hypothetical protein